MLRDTEVPVINAKVPAPHVAILLGSAREGSNTAKAVAILVQELEGQGFTADVIDPRFVQLALPGAAAQATPANAGSVAHALQRRVTAAHGVIMATPEYDGSYSAVIKLLIEHLGYPSVLAGKPVALLGVATGQIGAIRAVDHLRGVCIHIGALVVPGVQSVATVHKGFDASGKVIDPAMDKTIRSVARELKAFLARQGRVGSAQG